LLPELFEKQPSLALRLASMESREMDLCQHHQAFRSSKDSHESIAFLLLELFHRTRLQMRHNYDPVKNSIVFPLTQEDIGDAVGLTNVHVNRVLRQFTKDGLIECHHRRLRIIDEVQLSEIGEFNEEMIAGNPLI
jgi:CRP/FNR family transcriptional regulator